MQKYKRLLIIVLSITSILIISKNSNDEQSVLYSIDSDALQNAQTDKCPKQLIDVFSNGSQIQQYEFTQNMIKMFHPNALQAFMEAGKTFEEYEAANSMMFMMPGAFLFLVALFLFIFQFMVFKTKKNKICKRNLEMNKIKPWELQINYFNMIFFSFVLIGISIVLIIDLEQFKTSMTVIQCSYNAFYNEYFNGSSSQIPFGITNPDIWLGYKEVEKRKGYVKTNLNEQLTKISSIVNDFSSYNAKNQQMTQTISSMYNSHHNKQMLSPDRTDYGTTNKVDSLFLKSNYGPESLPGTINGQHQIMLDREQITQISQQQLALNGPNQGIYQYMDNIQRSGQWIMDAHKSYMDTSAMADLLQPIGVALTYCVSLIALVLAIGGLALSKSLYMNYRLKVSKRTSLVWVCLLIISMAVALNLMIILPQLISMSDQCGLSYMMTTPQQFNTYNYMAPDATQQVSSCLFGDGQLYSLIDNYDSYQQIQNAFVYQMKQYNISDYTNSMYIDVYKTRGEVQNEIIKVQGIQTSWNSDSSLTNEKNNVNALEAMSKFTDFSINEYINCKITKDRYVLQTDQCPNDYTPYQSLAATPSGDDKKVCILLTQMDTATLKLRYQDYITVNEVCKYQIDELEQNFKQLKIHYDSRFSLFEDILTEYQNILNTLIEVEPTLLKEQEETLKTYDQKQLIMLNYFTNNEKDFNCKFVIKHKKRIEDATCQLLLPALFMFTLKLVMFFISLFLLANRLFCFINFQKLMNKQIKLYSHIKKPDAAQKKDPNSSENMLLFLDKKENDSPDKSTFNPHSRIEELVDQAMSSMSDEIELPSTVFNQAHVNAALENQGDLEIEDNDDDDDDEY